MSLRIFASNNGLNVKNSTIVHKAISDILKNFGNIIFVYNETL